jgi:hypothetical protein
MTVITGADAALSSRAQYSAHQVSSRGFAAASRDADEGDVT